MIQPNFQVSVDGAQKKLRRFQNHAAVKHLVRETGDRIRRMLEVATPKDPNSESSGRLARSWLATVRPKGQRFELTIHNEDERAKKVLPVLLRGSRPHRIRTRVARVMAFLSEGKDAFATEVLHPGTKPSSTLVRAVEKSIPAEIDALRAAILRTKQRAFEQ